MKPILAICFKCLMHDLFQVLELPWCWLAVLCRSTTTSLSHIASTTCLHHFSSHCHGAIAQAGQRWTATTLLEVCPALTFIAVIKMSHFSMQCSVGCICFLRHIMSLSLLLNMCKQHYSGLEFNSSY